MMALAELADYLAVPRKNLYRVIVEKDLRFPAFKVERKWCVYLEDVQAWLLRVSMRQAAEAQSFPTQSDGSTRTGKSRSYTLRSLASAATASPPPAEVEENNASARRQSRA
jgi:excisionase family DNA binding protein